jgi:CelD/BcsL family acetyltransferase involved in cellulose biosynthesis
LRRIVVARTADEVQSLRSRWEYLQARCSCTTFQTYKWNSIAVRIFDHEEPHVIFCETEGGMAVLPLCINRGRRVLSCLGDVLFDYRDVLSVGEKDALVAAWETASLTGLQFSSGGALANARTRWTGFKLNPFYRAPMVKTSEVSAAEFAATHTRSASRLRRLARMGVVLREYVPANPSLVRWIYEQKACQPPEAGESVFSDPRRIEFMAAVVGSVPQEEEVFTLESKGKCVAALVTLREHRWRRFYTIWFDQEWANHSPGICLIYEVTRRSLEQGLNCDYMTGEQDYKMRFATSVELMYWIEATVEQMRDLAERQKTIAA